MAQDPGGGQAGQGGQAGGGAGGSVGGGGAPGGSIPPGGGIPGNTPPGGSRVPQQMPPYERQPQQQPFPEMQRPIFLSGKVMLDDGTPPPEPVVIERICNGVVRPEGWTDSKGRFSFSLGQNQAMMQDASVSSADPFGGGGFGTAGRSGMGGMGGRGISERDLMGCELRATLPGFRSEMVNLTGRRVLDNPDVGTIILKRIGNVEGLTISATTALAPKDARKAYDKGRELAKKKKWPEAQKEMEKAVGVYPKFAAAWYELGVLKQQQNDIEGAKKAFAESWTADSKFVKPYLQVAGLSAGANDWAEVAELTDKVIRLNPYDFPQAFFYNSIAYLNLKKLDQAEKSAREAVKLDTQHRMPKAQHVLGIILAQKNEFPEAATFLKGYLQYAPNASDIDVVKRQLAEVERLSSASAAAPASEAQPAASRP